MAVHNRPIITIIIPTCNRASLLTEALESALEQTYPAVDVIVVNDGSSDGTSALLDGYAGRITVLQQENRGVSAARNAGLRVARGEFVTFLDDDDRIYPGKIACQVKSLQENPRAGWVYCRNDYIDMDGRLLARGGVLPAGDVLVELLHRNFIWIGAPLIRREVIEQSGGFDEQLSSAADYDLWLRICAAGYSLACVQDRLGAYRLQPGSMVTNVRQTEEEIFLILGRIFSHPDLAEPARAVRRQAYAAWNLWLSRRYYAVGDLRTGKRALHQALQLDPRLSGSPSLRQAFWEEAVDWRVEDGQAYIDNVIRHLPDEALSLEREQAPLEASVLVAQSLKACALWETARSEKALRQALAVDPSLPTRVDELAYLVSHYALILPVEPLDFVERFLVLLRLALPGWQGRRAVRSAVQTALGFEAYLSGNTSLAARQFLRAAASSPAALKNRGVAVALLKSLPGMFFNL